MQADRIPGGIAGEVAAELVGSVAPGTGPIARRLFGRVTDEWSRSRSLTLEAAEHSAGMSRWDLAEQIDAHPELVPLVTRLLNEAAMNGQHRVLEAMGAVFGQAARNPDASTLCERVMRRAAALDEPDILVLREIQEKAVIVLNPDASPPRGPDATLAQAVVDVAETLGMSPDECEISVRRLQNEGHTMTQDVSIGVAHACNQFGRLLCDALQSMVDAKGT